MPIAAKIKPRDKCVVRSVYLLRYSRRERRMADGTVIGRCVDLQSCEYGFHGQRSGTHPVGIHGIELDTAYRGLRGCWPVHLLFGINFGQLRPGRYPLMPHEAAPIHP